MNTQCRVFALQEEDALRERWFCFLEMQRILVLSDWCRGRTHYLYCGKVCHAGSGVCSVGTAHSNSHLGLRLPANNSLHQFLLVTGKPASHHRHCFSAPGQNQHCWKVCLTLLTLCRHCECLLDPPGRPHWPCQLSPHKSPHLTTTPHSLHVLKSLLPQYLTKHISCRAYKHAEQGS